MMTDIERQRLMDLHLVFVHRANDAEQIARETDNPKRFALYVLIKNVWKDAAREVAKLLDNNA